MKANIILAWSCVVWLSSLVVFQVCAQTIYVPYACTNFAGLPGVLGNSDGAGTAARFNAPAGIATDANGNVFVADRSNETIRKITPAGSVSTFAGLAGVSGSADGNGSVARFNQPAGVAIDGAGNVYVADKLNDTIRMITPSGEVTTLAGKAGVSGSSDGIGSAARFNQPRGIALDSATNLYIGDLGNNTVRKVTLAGVVTTIAGKAGSSGTNDGNGSSARFNEPYGVVVDTLTNIYVADADNSTIRKVTPVGRVTTFAGSAMEAGNADGVGASARFNFPIGLAIDSAGNIYVADYSNENIRKITTNGVVTTLAGLVGQSGTNDGIGSTARFSGVWGVAIDNSGFLYVSDQDYNDRITKGVALLQFDTSWQLTLCSNTIFSGHLVGPPFGNVVLQRSADLENWTPVDTNSMSAGSWIFSLGIGSSPSTYFRAVALP